MALERPARERELQAFEAYRPRKPNTRPDPATAVPDGSVRIIVRRDDDLPGGPSKTFWCDPEHDYCVVKAIHPVYTKKTGERSLAYIDTERFLNFQKPPSGHW